MQVHSRTAFHDNFCCWNTTGAEACVNVLICVDTKSFTMLVHLRKAQSSKSDELPLMSFIWDLSNSLCAMKNSSDCGWILGVTEKLSNKNWVKLSHLIEEIQEIPGAHASFGWGNLHPRCYHVASEVVTIFRISPKVSDWISASMHFNESQILRDMLAWLIRGKSDLRFICLLDYFNDYGNAVSCQWQSTFGVSNDVLKCRWTLSGFQFSSFWEGFE